jgi:hypothetical protein
MILKELILNNIKVLGAYIIIGFLFMIILLFFMMVSENAIPLNLSLIVTRILITLSLILYLGMHYFSGRYLLRTTENILIDLLSFFFIIVLIFINLLFFENDYIVFRFLFNPRYVIHEFVYLLTEKNYDKLSFIITVALSIIMQYFGLIRRYLID